MAKIKDIIALVDANKFNEYSDETKLRLVAVLDGKIAVDVLLLHPSETGQFNYSYPEGLEMEPLVHFPHDDIYEKWMEAQIDFKNGEYEKYQNSMEQFNAAYENFVNWLLTYHTPERYLGTDTDGTGESPLYYITAYGLAVKQGFAGSLAEWLESLKGAPGDPGTFEDMTPEQIELVAERTLKQMVIDETLTEPGRAADAAAVGEALEKLETIIPLGNGEDLDKIVDPGRYACETDETAKTLLGCPVKKRFTLDVRYANGKAPYVGQELRPAGKGARLYRQFVSFPGILSDEGKALYERMQGVVLEGAGYNGKPDTGWYDESGDYTLTDAAELYGFAQMVNDGNTFIGETVRLGADIIVNIGNASNWNADTTGLWLWTPIGSSTTTYFCGTFDGQGHYISGLYGRQNNNGLFGFTSNCTIQNLAVINSFFGTITSKGQFLSSVVARAYGGVLKNLYSNAKLVSKANDWYTGGIAGCIRSGTMDSCVFAGVIDAGNGNNNNKYVGGIVGGPDGGVYTATITNCLFIGKIISNDSGVGGIVGMLGPDGLVGNCVAIGNNTAITGAKNVGAIIGYLSGAGNHTITDCYYSENLGLSLYGDAADGSVLNTSCSHALSAECVKHSMVPTQWMKVYDSENKLTLEDIGAAAIDVLWVNADPGGYFGAQTLEFDLSSYDYVAVVAAESSSYSPTYIPPVIVPCAVDSYGNMSCTGIDFNDPSPNPDGYEVWVFNRRFCVQSDGLKFDAGSLYGAHYRKRAYQSREDKVVPMFILGIKGVVK